MGVDVGIPKKVVGLRKGVLEDGRVEPLVVLQSEGVLLDVILDGSEESLAHEGRHQMAIASMAIQNPEDPYALILQGHDVVLVVLLCVLVALPPDFRLESRQEGLRFEEHLLQRQLFRDLRELRES